MVNRAGSGTTQTIEQTGKQWKGGMALFGLLSIIGVIAAAGGAEPAGGIMLVIGFLGYLVARLGAWWHHG